MATKSKTKIEAPPPSRESVATDMVRSPEKWAEQETQAWQQTSAGVDGTKGAEMAPQRPLPAGGMMGQARLMKAMLRREAIGRLPATPAVPQQKEAKPTNGELKPLLPEKSILPDTAVGDENSLVKDETGVSETAENIVKPPAANAAKAAPVLQSATSTVEAKKPEPAAEPAPAPQEEPAAKAGPTAVASQVEDKQPESPDPESSATMKKGEDEGAPEVTKRDEKGKETKKAKESGKTAVAETEAGPKEGKGKAAQGRKRQGKRGKADAAKKKAEEAKAEAEAAPDPHQAIAPAAAAVGRRAATARRHAPASAPVGSAQAAAIEPKTQQTRSAAAETVKNLDAVEAKEVERQQFKDKLTEAIERATPEPKTEEDAEEVMETGAQKASAALGGELASQRDAAAGPMKTAVASEIDPATQAAPAETPLQTEQVGERPSPVESGPVVPVSRPSPDTSTDRAATDQMMAENEVTEEQLAAGNEPAFGPALETRAAAEANEATVETRYRQSEVEVQGQGQQTAQKALVQGLGGIHGERELRIGQVTGQQTETKGKDAAERQRITNKIAQIKEQTKSDVAAILDSMESEATETFEAGLKRAEDAYADAFEEAKGGIGTWLTTWGDDWDRHIEASLRTARRRYLNEVNTAIDQVADLVGAKLAEARKRVTTGRQQVEEFVLSLDASVKEYGEQALKKVSADFDAMESDINQRRDALINNIAQQWKASYERMSAMEEKLRAENKSFWQRVYDATVGVVKKIIAFKNMLLGILGRAAAVIGDIIAHPIRFLGNLIDGVKLGLNNFVKNIGTHMQEGLIAWLTGSLGEMGITLPEKWDLAGIFHLVMQILGVSFAQIMGKVSKVMGFDIMGIWGTIQEIIGIYQEGGITGLAKYGLEKIIGPDKMAMLMELFDIVQLVMTGDFGQLWEVLKGYLSSLKEMIFGKITEFIVEKVIKAGVTWVISLFNPASAFIRACMMIYDVIVFFVERAAQIKSLVEAVIGAVAAIAKGNIGAMAKSVENALARVIPVAISFLASLLGLGGVADKVRETIESVREMVSNAIDALLNSGPVKAVAGFIQKAVAKVKNMAKAGLEKAKSAVDLGKKDKEKESEKAPETNDPEHDAKVDIGLKDIAPTEQPYLKNGKISREDAESVAASVKKAHPIFTRLEVVDGGDSWNYEWAASDGDEIDTPSTKADEPITLWEDISGETLKDYLAGFQNWRTPREGQALGQTRSVPVQLAEISIHRNRLHAERLIDNSSTSEAKKNAAKKFVFAKITQAAQSQEELTIHRRLREAASYIQKLYGGRSQLSLDVEHLTEVAQNPEIYPRSRINRKYSAVSARIRKGTARPGSPEEEIMSMSASPSQKRLIARLYAEQLIDESLGDVGETVTYSEPQEIEIEIISTEVHKEITSRRAAERSNE